MDSVWIVYTPDWEGIELYFDELSAYKAAVKKKADVIQAGEGDIKEQAKSPRKFNNQSKEINNATTKKDHSDSERNNNQARGAGQRRQPIQSPGNQEPQGDSSQENPQTPRNPLEDRPADLAAAFNDIDFSASQRPNPKPGS